MLRLVLPDKRYKKGFYDYLKQLLAVKEIGSETASKIRSKDFSAYVKELRKMETHPLDGQVQQTEYWLIDSNSFVGNLRLRHRLNKKLIRSGGHIGYTISPPFRRKGYGKKILQLGLRKAKILGLKKVLLTCGEKNIASRRIIQSCGGVYKNEARDEDGDRMLRFWIALDSRE
jgi:predicted acetyltransferase